MHMLVRRNSSVSILERRALRRNLDGNRKREERGDIEGSSSEHLGSAQVRVEIHTVLC